MIQILSSWVIISQPCFVRKISLTSLIFLIPRPPLLFGLQILSSYTMSILKTHIHIIPKKASIYLINFLADVFRIFGPIHRNLRMLVQSNFIKTTLPAFDSTWVFQPANFHPKYFLISSSTLFLLLSIFEHPKYVPVPLVGVISKMSKISFRITSFVLFKTIL